jgi:hypothetical protein
MNPSLSNTLKPFFARRGLGIFVFLMYSISGFSFSASAFPVTPSYIPTSLTKLFLGADRIVYGEITEVDSATFTVQVEKNLYHEEKSFTVRKFPNWACHTRWAPYKKGQKLFLFLGQHEGQYFSLGAANEGELPIYNQKVHISYIATGSMPYHPKRKQSIESTLTYRRLPCERYYLPDGKYDGFAVDLDVFIKVMETYKSCYSTVEKTSWREYSVESHCSEEEVDSIWTQSANNPLMRWCFYFSNRKNKMLLSLEDLEAVFDQIELPQELHDQKLLFQENCQFAVEKNPWIRKEGSFQAKGLTGCVVDKTVIFQLNIPFFELTTVDKIDGKRRVTLSYYDRNVHYERQWKLFID